MPAGPALIAPEGGVGTLRLTGDPRHPAPLTLEALHRLDELIDEAEAAIEAGSLAALVVRIGVPGGAPGDIDPDEIRGLPDAEAARIWAQEGQRVLGRIERLAVPTVAVLAGRCLWGGVQVALACGHRLAVASPDTRIGLPETRLGVLPAWGGTVRLPRLIGVRAALRLLLERETVSVRRAESMGLVDQALPPRAAEIRTRRFAERLVLEGRRGEGSRRGIATRVLEDTAPGRRLVFASAARRSRRRSTVDEVTAAALVHAVADGIARPLEEAFRYEADTFATLLQQEGARARLHAAVATRDPADGSAGAIRIRRTAVLGAGARGTALTHLLASHGLTVRLKDLRREATTRAVGRVRAMFERDVQTGRIREEDVERRMRRVSGTTGFGGFGRVDAVLEAVGERLDAKRSALREVEEHVRDSCIFLSTSPLLSVGEIQEGVERTVQVAGLHVAHPDFRVGEVVRGPQTAEPTVQAVAALVRRLGRVPVVVADHPGLLVSRLLAVYLGEALRLRAEGMDPVGIDEAMRRWGMPRGPLEWIAILGADRVAGIAAGLAERIDERFRLPERTSAPESGAATRLARAAWRTLRALPLPGARAEGGAERGANGSDRGAEVVERLVLLLANEASRALEEGVVADAWAVDRAVALSLGFPAERGGLLFHADRIGAAQLVGMLGALAARHGPRYRPSSLLLAMAARDARFFGAHLPALPPHPVEIATGQGVVEVLR